MSLRLTSGSGNDDFDIRVKITSNGTSTYSNTIRYLPNDDSSDHDNFKVIPFPDYISYNSGGNFSYTFTLEIRNIGLRN